MTVYLDIVFLENLFINYIILFATGYILKIKKKQFNIFLSSIIGSGYAIYTYMQNSFAFSSIWLKIILSILMILVAFFPKKIKIFLKELVLFYLISFVFGGCSFFLLYFVKPQNILVRNGMLVGKYPIQIAMLSGIVGFIITEIAFKTVKMKITKKDIFVDLTICEDNKKIHQKALIDTGNMLKDPITNMPVIVVFKNELYQLFPKEILDNIDNIINGKLSNDIFLNNQQFISKIRIIPFSSLGKQNGLLLGIKVDEVKVYFSETCKTVHNVIIGIYEKPLTKNNKYTALLGLDFLERGEEDGFIAHAKIKY